MEHRIDRRRFVASAASVAAATVVPREVLGGPGRVAPSDRITVAQVGMGTQAVRMIGSDLADPRVRIVAVCDPNTDSSDYVEWGRGEMLRRIRGLLGDPNWRAGSTGCPAGREIGRLVVETHYARQRRGPGRPGPAAWADFREMLASQKDLDAVKVITPDHAHAAIAVAALEAGKHVVMHKPIANRLREGRRVLEAVRKTGRATHLLAYGSGAENGRIVRFIRSGIIGTLREVHNWTNRPVWPQYTEIPTDRPPVPKGFRWDLWLGPVPERPYHPHYTHTVYRGWYDFGGGSLADMGYYSLWPVFTGLQLDPPISAEAWGTHTCRISDHVSRPARNDFAYPAASTQRFHFGPRGDRPAVELFWYDGGMKPRFPDLLEPWGVSPGRSGILFVGDDGAILADFLGRGAVVYTKKGKSPLPPGEPAAGSAPPAGAAGWVESILAGKPSPASFLHAGAITDAVNLGTVALRAGRKVLFDGRSARITNAPQADRLLTREYRDGWEM